MLEQAEITDEALATAIQCGHAQQFGLLVERYEAKMIRYARKFLFNAEDSQDLAQEVFIKAYVNINSFDPARKFSSWLYRIAHNEYINALKKKSREHFFSFDFDVFLPHPPAKQTADGELLEAELKRALDESLNTLPVKYREPLVLYYFEDLDYKEIADVLQIPAATVGVRLNRGKALLKKIITPEIVL